MSRVMCKSAKDYFTTMGNLCGLIDWPTIDALADQLLEVWRNKRQIFVFGNGGSACTAGHFVIELVMTAGGSSQRGLKAMALSDNIGTLTALANDIAYDDIFRYPLVSHASPQDVVLAISGSGNSPNVLRACEWAKAHGLLVVALTGFNGGQLKQLADIHINVPNDNYGIIEDLHMSIGHILGQRLHHAIAAESA